MEITKEILLLKIEYFREELIKVGTYQGFANPETIRLSQNLDKLIPHYSCIRNKCQFSVKSDSDFIVFFEITGTF